MVEKVQGICEECGVEFWGRAGYKNHAAGRFCGHSCACKYIRRRRLELHPPEEKRCEWDGQAFIVGGGPLSKKHRGIRFCSNTCAQAYLKDKRAKRLIKTKICPADGVIFKIGKGYRDARRQFCSQRCAQKARYVNGDVSKALTLEQASYFAGIFDGEGTVHLFKMKGRSVSVRITIVNTYKGLIEWLITSTGIGTTFHRTGRSPNHKDCYWWQASGDAAISCLRQMLPYLIIKKLQAELAIQHQENLRVPRLKINRTWQEENFNRMKALNARGPQPAIQLTLMEEEPL